MPAYFPNLQVPDFLAKINQLGGPAKSCRFAVLITPSGDNNLIRRLPYGNNLSNLLYVCDSVEFPGRGFGVTNIRYYGPGQVMPNNVEYGPCNLSFICNNRGFERQFFDDWQDIINPTTNFNYRYPNEYYCDIEIFQFSEYTVGAGSLPPGTSASFTQLALNKTPQVIYNWKLYKCWPTFVNPQQVTWADNSDILRLQVTLAYRYWDRPNATGFVPQQVTTTQNPAAQILTNSISK